MTNSHYVMNNLCLDEYGRPVKSGLGRAAIPVLCHGPCRAESNLVSAEPEFTVSCNYQLTLLSLASCRTGSVYYTASSRA